MLRAFFSPVLKTSKEGECTNSGNWLLFHKLKLKIEPENFGKVGVLDNGPIFLEIRPRVSGAKMIPMMI